MELLNKIAGRKVISDLVLIFTTIPTQKWVIFTLAEVNICVMLKTQSM
jgi:hypothetical protein